MYTACTSISQNFKRVSVGAARPSRCSSGSSDRSLDREKDSWHLQKFINNRYTPQEPTWNLKNVLLGKRSFCLLGQFCPIFRGEILAVRFREGFLDGDISSLRIGGEWHSRIPVGTCKISVTFWVLSLSKVVSHAQEKDQISFHPLAICERQNTSLQFLVIRFITSDYIIFACPITSDVVDIHYIDYIWLSNA